MNFAFTQISEHSLQTSPQRVLGDIYPFQLEEVKPILTQNNSLELESLKDLYERK